MSTTVKIQLTEEAKQIVAGMQTMPARTVQAIADAMNKENQLTIAHIQAEHLTGIGPFPVEEHKLGVRTNRLRSSVNASEAKISGETIDSSIGSNVKYAFPHEFGMRIPIPARKQKVRLRTDARGNLVKQLKHSNLARFARQDHKRVRESTVDVGAHEIVMPERAPFRTGIAECAPNYTRSISAAIVDTWRNKS